MGERPELSLVIPAYNEASGLPRVLPCVIAYLEREVPDHEILLVDDGSRDETPRVAEQLLAGHTGGRVLSYSPNRGKGAAVRTGALAAQGRAILFSDADFSTPIEEEVRFRAALSAGADVVIGSRAHAQAQITQAQGAVRQSMGRTFNVLVRLVGLSSFHDTQCGFKMFRGEAAHDLFGRALIDGFAFDVEVLWLAERAGMRIAELPVEWRNDPESRVRMFRDSARMVLELLRIRWRHCAD